MPDLLAHLRKRAPDVIDVPILQPADPFLEMAGEDLRRRIFITESGDGRLNCLRPDFTIPICRGVIEKKRTGRYAYCGTVFRQNRDGSEEFLQLGLEDIGHDDRIAADATCLSDMLDCLNAAGIIEPKITLGDDLFCALIDSLALPETIAQRLQRAFGQNERLDALLDQFSSEPIGEPISQHADIPALTMRVEVMMQEAALPPMAGRSPADIAERMVQKSSIQSFRLEDHQLRIIRNYLAIKAPLTEAGAAVRAFFDTHQLGSDHLLAAFDARVEAIRARGIRLDGITFDASFGRKLEYYTGMQFEVFANGVAIGGGGRYDSLLTLLGSPTPKTGVGFSIALDRVAEALA
ncbi:MAG: ATP phosphoribosyltransferase regulatory subunit [Ahrensia sp.]|nr:ATP phosphoribosyltransferase regulatory subunit [Ahrensia sp.]